MRHVLTLCLTLLALPAVAQDTPSGLRQDIQTLRAEFESLRADLAAQGGGAVTGSTLDRLNTIESELARLTGRVEELEFRVGQVVRDGTNRLGDLEFRVCELDPGCDIGTLGKTRPIGGDPAAQAAPVASAVASGNAATSGPELAVGEEGDARRAQEALAKGDFRSAADQFAAFRQTYPGSPLEPEILLGLGQALEGLGDIREAARAYLDAYSNYPDHPVAPEALTRLGQSLGNLGKTPEACVTLAEVANRYPDSDQVDPARVAMQSFGCQ